MCIRGSQVPAGHRASASLVMGLPSLRDWPGLWAPPGVAASWLPHARLWAHPSPLPWRISWGPCPAAWSWRPPQNCSEISGRSRPPVPSCAPRGVDTLASVRQKWERARRVRWPGTKVGSAPPGPTFSLRSQRPRRPAVQKGIGATRMGRLWPLRCWPSSRNRLSRSSSSEE